MKPITKWLEEYGESHQNPINKKIHWICVPLIMLSLIGLLWYIPFPFNFPFSLSFESIENFKVELNWATLFLIFCVVFYYKLSKVIMAGMIAIAIFMIIGVGALNYLPLNPVVSCLIIFVSAWIGQFAGHEIEGRKPSFFEDLQFLLIGPAWLLSFIFDRLGVKY